MRLTLDQANKAYDILEGQGGANPDERDSFIHYVTKETPGNHEWRFRGKLGEGGKLKTCDIDGLQVTCYQEDRSEERDRLVKELNRLLSGVH